MMLRISRPLLLFFGAVLYGQDAGLVLRTSVGYNTQKATLQLSEEQRKQADQFGQEAQQASRAGKFGDAMRAYAHGLAVMRGVAWTPAYETASSLQGHLDHAMVAPGQEATVVLKPLYGSGSDVKLGESLFLLPAKKDGSPDRRLATGNLSLNTRIAIPDAPAGDYLIEVRLAPEGDPPAAPARPAFVKSIPIHIEPLSDAVAQLRARLAKADAKPGAALPTAQYALALYDQADAGEINPSRYHFRQEFSAANALLDALAAGHDPYAGRHGDMRKAYRSAVDNTLQPYRVFVPDAYDPAKATPLVVALHGMGGDENSMFDAYRDGLLKTEAARLGFLVVCPKGRDTASMYRGSAEQDVMDVLAEVRRDYRVDAKRIYLMGHSMGAYGTWSVAMSHPDVFAALGPISGGGDTNGMEKIKHIPQYVVHGDDDRTVNVSQSRRMVEAGKKAGANIVYVEIPGGSHVDVAAPQFGPMLDFFAKQSK